MKCFTLAMLLCAVPAAVADAQPQHGDLVVAVGSGGSGHSGYFPPAKPVNFTTLSMPLWTNWVRMAHDNSDLVVSEFNTATTPMSGFLSHVHPGGGSTRRVTLANPICDGFALDHDGWIGCARAGSPSPTLKQTSLFHATLSTLTTLSAPAIKTLWTAPLPVHCNEMAIDRDPGPWGGAPYVLAACCGAGTGTHPMLLRADRRGNLTTILSTLNSPFRNLRAIEVDPRSGDFLLLESTGGLFRVTKSGTSITTLVAGLVASALKIAQDGHLWIAANNPDRVVEYDLATNTTVNSFPLPGAAGFALQGIEVYGSRVLTCNKNSASTVHVVVRSWSTHVTPNFTSYALAASFARRPPNLIPSVRFPNGEYLDLDVTGPLFLLSVQGLLPGVFGKQFQGTLVGGSGVATAAASITIPLGLQGSGIPVFVGGVLYDNGVIRQVTNTHWFVM